MIDFKGKIAVFEGGWPGYRAELAASAANDRKNGVDSTGYKGTVEEMTGF